ncbi:hypothetical protein W97_04576 [Coniosporium apollinis CBS 100218]|uniref:Endoplasmic reticulum junction formation protein lunapark n=1 Tax=Coniosporium apollinis (strain CBS 100218) TaxID=1168221 RepID=R7YU08_CONA1|nr:uncharacterized protein W97_04576 [Coniosporium apollinis CBS 100218]EON65338.1 hypothetical protein W97_04576 [Coniosporium apollinis CBS 100218]
MVSLWPWKGGDSSAASFEKTLSTLAAKISKASAKNDRLRQSSRRVRAMWTLYTSFAYMIVALILTLVTGWKNWSPVEYTAIAGGPVLIYGVRTAFTTFYNYRISNTQAYLDGLYKERDATIEKLKAATKYNTTQQLLEKYGSQRPTPVDAPSPQPKGKSPRSQKGTPQPGRTNIPPPPTANIPRGPRMSPAPAAPQSPPSALHPVPGYPPELIPQLPPPPSQAPGEEFAPNAFSTRPAPSRHPSAYDTGHSKWYDRILDVILGEDETHPKNRIALICSHCRLVNGQAPPGTRSLADLGKWKCAGCGGWNGQESEGRKIMEQVQREGAGGSPEGRLGSGDEGVGKAAEARNGGSSASDTGGDGSESGSSGDMVEVEDTTPVKATRSKTRGKN